MAGKTFTLEFEGKAIATITDANYATPAFSGHIEFADPKVGEQFAKITEFDAWTDSEEADNVTDEDFDAEMAKRGIEEKYYQMSQSGGWTTRSDAGGVMSAGLIVFDGDYVEWRPGEVDA